MQNIKKLTFTSIVMNLNYLKDKHKNFLFKLLQKREDMTYGTFGKYSDSNYTIE